MNTENHEATENTEAAAPAFSIEEAYIFGGNDLENAENAAGALAELCENAGIDFTARYAPDPEKGLPEGTALLFAPVRKQKEVTKVVDGEEKTVKQRVVDSYHMGLTADPEYLIANKPEFVAELVHDFAVARVSDMFYRAEKGADVSFPVSLSDILENNRKRVDDEAFKEIGPGVISKLKGTSPVFKIMNLSLLRNCLSSATVAKNTFAAVQPEQWDGLLDTMIEYAEKKGLNPGVLLSWKQTRHDSTSNELDEVDLGAFSL